MKTVIVPDVHQQLELVQSILDREGEAHYVWLGDFFDDYNDEPEQSAETAKWLYQRMLNTDDEFCLGNHDQWYLWPDLQGLMCSGNSMRKLVAIHDCMDVKAYQDRVKLWTAAEGWWLSHAGFNRNNFYMRDKHDDIKVEVKESAKNGRVHDLLQAGRARGGYADLGGINWLDFNKEFKPLKGINQMFGHTRGNTVRTCDHIRGEFVSSNICLDTHTHHYAVLGDDGMKYGEVSIRENV